MDFGGANRAGRDRGEDDEDDGDDGGDAKEVATDGDLSGMPAVDEDDVAQWPCS